MSSALHMPVGRAGAVQHLAREGTAMHRHMHRTIWCKFAPLNSIFRIKMQFAQAELDLLVLSVQRELCVKVFVKHSNLR